MVLDEVPGGRTAFYCRLIQSTGETMNVSATIGFAVAFVGSLLMASGNELQSRAVKGARGVPWRFLRDWRWSVGVLTIGTAIGCNLAALSLAPVTLIQPVGIVALVASVCFGVARGRVVLTKRDVWSITAVIAGVVGMITFVQTHPARTEEPASAHLGPVVICMTGGALLTLAALLTRRFLQAFLVELWLLVASAMTFGSIAASLKIFVGVGHSEGPLALLTQPSMAIGVVVLVASGLVASSATQRAHAFFPASVVMGSGTVIDPVTAGSLAIIVFGEVALDAWTGVGLLLSVGAAALGVLGISQIGSLNSTEALTGGPEVVPGTSRAAMGAVTPRPASAER